MHFSLIELGTKEPENISIRVMRMHFSFSIKNARYPKRIKEDFMQKLAVAYVLFRVDKETTSC